MIGSYTQHSADTLEYKQGRNSAEINCTDPYAIMIHNPYLSGSKEWLDWQIGYDSFRETFIPFYAPGFDHTIETKILRAKEGERPVAF